MEEYFMNNEVVVTVVSDDKAVKPKFMRGSKKKNKGEKAKDLNHFVDSIHEKQRVTMTGGRITEVSLFGVCVNTGKEVASRETFGYHSIEKSENIKITEGRFSFRCPHCSKLNEIVKDEHDIMGMIRKYNFYIEKYDVAFMSLGKYMKDKYGTNHTMEGLSLLFKIWNNSRVLPPVKKFFIDIKVIRKIYILRRLLQKAYSSISHKMRNSGLIDMRGLEMIMKDSCYDMRRP